MTKEEFVALQDRHRESGKSLKVYLREIGTSYTTYNYWRKKYLAAEEPQGLSPIRFKQASQPSSESFGINKEVPSGATLLFPNGLRAHFGAGTESILKELLEKSLVSHVLP